MEAGRRCSPWSHLVRATVLVVDDDLQLRELARRMLEGQGFHVVEARLLGSSGRFRNAR